MPVSGPLDGLLAREIVKYTRNNKRIRFHLAESSSENLMDLVATGIGITFIPNVCGKPSGCAVYSFAELAPGALYVHSL